MDGVPSFQLNAVLAVISPFPAQFLDLGSELLLFADLGVLALNHLLAQ